MHYPNDIEDLCYEQDHIDIVWRAMEPNIDLYFKKYVESERGNAVPDENAAKLAEVFGTGVKAKSKAKNKKTILNRLLNDCISNFERDRKSYIEHLDPEAMAEYKLDVGGFKNTILRNQIPIIRSTLQNKAAKDLDKYRTAFKNGDAGVLFDVTNNLVALANDWKFNWYESSAFEKIDTCDELGYYDFDEEGYYAFGVIGGGIKSHFVYKLFPELFSNRSRDAVWALWYLSNKGTFGCKQDSEFLMIDIDEGSTQQNYYYPYALFSFYALRLVKKLEKLYKAEGASIPEEYRFVAVDDFLSFVAEQHRDEIRDLKRGAEDVYDY